MVNSIVTTSKLSYAETVAALSKAITDHGNTIFVTIDQAAAAAGVGLSLRPTTLIVFGNPKGGTGLMVASPLSALDLPLKLLVWEDNGVVSVAYVPPETIAARYNLTGMDTLIGNFSHALAALANVVV